LLNLNKKNLKAESIHEIKTSLLEEEKKKLVDFCLRLAKHKKENKELLSYLLFDSGNEADYMNRVKEEMELSFKEINQSNLYFAKKTLRKILRITNKHIRFVASKAVEAELLIHYCLLLKGSGLAFKESLVLMNLYNQQCKKIHAAVESLHEDLRLDFQNSLQLL